MKIGKTKTTKKCPRCGNKCLIAQSKCEECGLLFSRMEYASNRAAKKKLLKFDRDFIIYTNQYPKDLPYWKVLLMTIFTGLFGGHYYYVGKYIKGGLMSASFVYLLFCTIFNAQMVELLETQYFYLPIGIAGFAWLYSLSCVILRKFKVPVTIQMPEVEDLRQTTKESTSENTNVENKSEIVVEKAVRKVEKKKNKKKSSNSAGKIEKKIKNEGVQSTAEDKK